MKQFSHSHRCPICGGYSEAAKGTGRRCWGYRMPDGISIVCTREEYSGNLEYNSKVAGYIHNLRKVVQQVREHNTKYTFKKDTKPTKTTNKSGKNSTITFDSLEDAKTSLSEKHGNIKGSWTYQDITGADILHIFRLEKDDEKTYRPVHPNKHGFKLGTCPEPYPLYNLMTLKGLPRGSLVFIVEGEKCADALDQLGFCATTSPGGAQAASRTDWSILCDYEVILLPDNDKPGKEYMAAVASELQLLRNPPRVRKVELAELPSGGDIVDYIESRKKAGCSTDRIVTEIQKTIDETEYLFGLIAVRASDIQPKELRWLWYHRIPLGKITLFTGDPDLGKSTVTLDIVSRVTTGSPWPDTPQIPNKAGNVLLLSAEDDPHDTIVPRLQASRCNLERVTIVEAVKTADTETGLNTFSLQRDIKYLRQYIRQNPQTRLIIIDPISAYLGGVDSHKNAEIRTLFEPLKRLVQDHDLSIIIVTHQNKTTGGKAIYRSSGSIGFVALARAAYGFYPDEHDENKRLFLPIKSNLAPKSVKGMSYKLISWPDNPSHPVVDWDPDPVSLTADEAVDSNGNSDDRFAIDEAMEWLESYLNIPTPSGEIYRSAEKDGIAKKTLKRAKKSLAIKSVREGFGESGKWIWLPKGHKGGQDEEN